MKKIMLISVALILTYILDFVPAFLQNNPPYSDLLPVITFNGSGNQYEQKIEKGLTDFCNVNLGFAYKSLITKSFDKNSNKIELSPNFIEKRTLFQNGVFQLSDTSILDKLKEISLKFRIRDTDDYYILNIIIKPFHKLVLKKYENGAGIQSEEQNILLWDKTNLSGNLYILYFKNYLLLMNEDRIIFYTDTLKDITYGGVSFLYSYAPPEKKKSPRVFHSSIDDNSVIYLEQELQLSHLTSTENKYHWNNYFPDHQISINDKKSEFVQRVEFNDTTRPALLLPSGAKAFCNLRIIGKSILHVSLSLVDKYIFDPQRIVFRISIKASGRPVKTINEHLDINQYKNHLWKDITIDLSEYSGEKIELTFEHVTTGKKLPVDDNIITVWGGPELNAQKKSNEKNVILIILDAVRPDHMSCYGYERKTSPLIDSLAENGALFKTAVTAAPWTLPSHMAIFSGLYPSECGYNTETFNKTVIPKGSFSSFSTDIHTMAEFLSENGYSTAAFTGGGMLRPEYNFDQGYRSFTHLNEDKSVIPHIMLISDWIKKYKDSKFFLTLHTYDTHCPYTHIYFTSKNSDSIKSSAIDSYDSGILFADSQIQKITEILKTEGILKDTLIIVMSDHGENFDTQYLKINETSSCGAHGVSLYDAELRIPLIFSGAGMPSGIAINDQVRTIDILPTILDFLKIKTGQEFRGRSVIPLLRGKELPEVFSYAEGLRATSDKVCNKFSVRTNNYKLIKNVISDCSTNLPEYELYDLQKDPNETANLQQLMPSVFTKMKNYLLKIRKSILQKKSKTVRGDLKELERLGYIDN